MEANTLLKMQSLMAWAPKKKEDKQRVPNRAKMGHLRSLFWSSQSRCSSWRQSQLALYRLVSRRFKRRISAQRTRHL